MLVVVFNLQETVIHMHFNCNLAIMICENEHVLIFIMGFCSCRQQIYKKEISELEHARSTDDIEKDIR